MSYVSLYRKYRSQTFGDLMGQDHVVRTLQNGITSGRISHSYLFTGPRGTGKTSTARLLAKALCCEIGPAAEPDNTCEICQSITLGNCIDVVEMDAASESGVGDIREQIVDAIEYKPMICRYKIFIIDEVHDLSRQAFDALLKTVEEPPPHIIFILATTEFNKVPPTIRSRCQKYEFHRAGMKDLTSRLDYVLKEEGIEAEPAAVGAIARMADGGYRDALTLLEQAMLTKEGKITLSQVYDQLGLVSEDAIDGLLIAIRESRVPEIVARIGEMTQLGRDPRAILESMMYRLSDLTRAIFQMDEPSGDAAREAALHETAVQIGKDAILRLRADIGEAFRLIRDISLPRLWLESELVRLSLPPVHAHVNPPVARPVAPPSPRPAAPSPEPKVEAKHEPADAKPAAHFEPTGDPAFDKARLAWHEAKLELSKSPTMKIRVETAVLVACEENRLSIQMTQGDIEWMHDKPVRAEAIAGAMKARLGPETQIHYVARERSAPMADSGAVELTLEGQRLEQAARDILGKRQEG